MHLCPVRRSFIERTLLARAAVHDDPLRGRVGEDVADQARDRVGAAACGQRQDDTDRLEG